jgi:hypothetical protein
VATPYPGVRIYSWRNPGFFSICLVRLIWKLPWVLFCLCEDEKVIGHRTFC